MDYLRPKRASRPFDPRLIENDLIEYLKRLTRQEEASYFDIWQAFKRVERHLTMLLNLDDDFWSPPRVRQAAQPTLSSGELKIWSDSDDDKVYLLYNDPDAGHVSVELT